MFGFVGFHLVSSVQSQVIAEINVSKMTYFCMEWGVLVSHVTHIISDIIFIPV